MSGVNAGMSTYLFTHPDVNAFFTGLKGKSREEMRTEITNVHGRKSTGAG